MEKYRTIPGFSNYEVSNLGNIWNTKTGYVLSTKSKDKDGYVKITLFINGVRHYKRLHILVALTFLENPENKPLVDHINGEPADNRLINLRFANAKENVINSKISSRNTSGVKGVSYDTTNKRWKAGIKIDGISIHLGNFKTIEEAQQARVAKANEVFGIFTHSCEKL
jgi:hypothetical protein